MEEQLSLFGDPVPVCRYLVVTYCDDIKYDDKKDFRTVSEAIADARRYLKGFPQCGIPPYDGAAVWDYVDKRYCRIYGDFPDERAHRDLVECARDDLRKASGSPDFDKRFRTACRRYGDDAVYTAREVYDIWY